MSATTDAKFASKERAREVELAPLHLENIYTHFHWNNDPELNRLDSEVPFVEEMFGVFKHRFEGMLEEPSPDSRDFEVHTHDGKLIGVAYISDISWHSRHCTVGVTIGDKAYWGKGYGTAAMDKLLAYCFDEIGMHRVCTATFPFNEAWKRLIAHFGFRPEGVKREYLWRDDRFWDKQEYALLEDEYRSSAVGGDGARHASGADAPPIPLAEARKPERRR